MLVQSLCSAAYLVKCSATWERQTRSNYLSHTLWLYAREFSLRSFWLCSVILFSGMLIKTYSASYSVSAHRGGSTVQYSSTLCYIFRSGSSSTIHNILWREFFLDFSIHFKQIVIIFCSVFIFTRQHFSQFCSGDRVESVLNT